MTPTPLDESAGAFVARVKVMQRLLVVRLATLRRIVMRSAGIAYGRELGLCDNDWLVLTFIGMQRKPVLAVEIGRRLVLDKGQISRVVSRLVDAGLVVRQAARGPLGLSRVGRRVYGRIERIIEQRNAALLDAIGADEQRILDPALDKLFAGADVLLADERRFAGLEVEREFEHIERPGRVGDAWRWPQLPAGEGARRLIMPDLQVLLRHLRQSAKLAYGRVTGLSNFDWLTLTYIAMQGPLTLVDLIALLDRNKSQVGRALNRLVAQGIASRAKQAGVSSVVVAITAKGEAAYEAVLEEARRRDERLIADLTMREYRTLVSILDRMTENALALLEHERALSRTSGAADDVMTADRARDDD
jgi:DNA-binding MarR family transcriptional regulator